jgi:hypothetical protein
LVNRVELQQPLPGDDFLNIIHLSEAFYQEVQQHRIPVERRVVAALANAPGTLDLYVWLVWKSWTLVGGRRAVIPILGEAGLTHQLGSKPYGRERDFREKLSSGWLRLRLDGLTARQLFPRTVAFSSSPLPKLPLPKA